jgi:hypothetical protein
LLMSLGAANQTRSYQSLVFGKAGLPQRAHCAAN